MRLPRSSPDEFLIAQAINFHQQVDGDGKQAHAYNAKKPNHILAAFTLQLLGVLQAQLLPRHDVGQVVAQRQRLEATLEAAPAVGVAAQQAKATTAPRG